MIGNNVITINNNAFENCTSLTSITIPNSVTEIYSYSFNGCTSLANVNWSNSLISINQNAFYGCTSLTSVRFPGSLKTIKQHAFSGCTLLERIILNEGLTTINHNAFANTAITEMIIPDSVTTITNNSAYNNEHDSIFEGCTKLKRVVLGDGLTTLTEYLFKGLTALEEVVIGNNVITINNNAFDSCTALESVVMPDSVAQINNYAFRNTGLRNVKIPENVHTIGNNVFSDSSKLEYLLFEGTALKSVGSNVTNSCPSARRIYYKGTITEWNTISINKTNSAPFNQLPYIYSQYKPTQTGNYWHYASNGEPIVWDISLSEYKVYAMTNAYTGTMGSSLLSCSTAYINEMENDSAFMTQKRIYDLATIVSDVGSIGEHQMTKEQLYMIVLLDVLGYNYSEPSETPELATYLMRNGAFVYSYINTASGVVDVQAFKELLPYFSGIGTFLDVFGSVANTANDNYIAKQNLLGFAMQCENSLDVLTVISQNTKNDKYLRVAADKVIEIIKSAFEGTLKEVISKNTHIQIAKNLANIAISSFWGEVLDVIPYYALAQCIAEGVKITLDIFCDTGVSIDAYYKLQVTEFIESALRNQILALNGDYLRRENLVESALLYGVINFYSSAITKGYEYTLSYLDSVDKDSSYIAESYAHNQKAFKQFEVEIENTYYSLYGY